MTSTSGMNRARRTRPRPAVILLGLIALCGMGLPVAAQDQPNLGASGSWLSSQTDGKEGSWTLAAVKSGTTLTGTVTTNGPADFNAASIYGAFSETGDIHFGVLYNDAYEATFDGAVSGKVVSGTYTTKDGDSGTWAGNFGAP